MFKIYGGATEFKQWELDQMVTNPCMKAGDEVVFRNASGETYVTKAFEQNGEVVADVPNYLLQKALNILVDLEQGADKHDDCRTTFVVVAQDQPDGYECKHNLPDRPVKTAGGVSSWNDLTDRPFGTEIGEILPECELMGLDQDEDGTVDGFVLTKEMNLTVGKTYTVNYNGTEYPCVAQDISETTGGIPSIGLGNMEPMGLAGNGEPFAVMYSPEMMAMTAGEGVTGTVMALDGAESVTLSVEGEVVKPIDAEYLPAETVRRMEITFTKVDNDIAAADKTFEEVRAAYNEGYDLVGIYEQVVDESAGTFNLWRVPFAYYHGGGDMEAFVFSKIAAVAAGTAQGFTFQVMRNGILFTEYER